MAMVQCKECGGQISQNADTCPHCGDVIKEPKPKFSLVDLIHKISVPVILSVAGTMITILTFFSMEGERQMEQTRKLLADAFDKDPIKQQYCIFYVDHLLAAGRLSPEMTVSVLSTVAANATSVGRQPDCTLWRFLRPRLTFSRMSEAAAVQTNGLGSAL
jgi:rRNA maturation protein Nop10